MISRRARPMPSASAFEFQIADAACQPLKLGHQLVRIDSQGGVAMRSLRTWSSTRAYISALTAFIAIGAAASVRGDEAPSLPAEVQQIQRALGGPAIDQFQELRPAAPALEEGRGRGPKNADPAAAMPLRPTPSAPPGAWGNWTTSPGPWSTSSTMATPPDRRAVAQAAALREAAAQLDGSANRLETLALYQQADAMRTLAQRLRLGSREMIGGRPGAVNSPSVLNQPSQPLERPTEAPSLGRSAQPAPTLEPTPADSN